MRTFSWLAVLIATLFTASSWAQSCGSPYTTVYRYDQARQVVGTIKPSAGSGYEAVRNTYDANGRVTKVERGVLASCQGEEVAPASWAGFDVKYFSEKDYDDGGRVTAERTSGPTLTHYSYDNVGRLQCKATRLKTEGLFTLLSACEQAGPAGRPEGPDRISMFVYDDAGRLDRELRGLGTELGQPYVRYGYTVNGLQDWVMDASNNYTDFTYDGFDRLSQTNFPESTVGTWNPSTSDYETYGYDNNNNRTSMRLRSGETISYQYDALNRLAFKDLPGVSNDVTYTYDNFGLSASAQISSGGLGIVNHFNGFSNLEWTDSTAPTGTLRLKYDYDADGNRTKVEWPDGTFVKYTYDGLGRMDKVQENGVTSGPGVLADYSYDSFGRRAYLYRGNGTLTDFDYDTASRLSGLTQDLASTSRDLTLGFSYNPANQVTRRTVSNDAYSYFSLTQSKSYARTGLNTYASVGGVTFGYDGRGNLTSDGSRTFAYDLENHLLSVSGGAAPVSLAYDPNGRLLTSTSGGVTTRYLYDGDELVAEYNGSTLTRRYVHGANTDEPLVWYEGAGLTDRRWLHTDHLGSVVASSDTAGVGTVYAYGAYGEPAYDNWGGSRFRYTGQIMLPEAKLYHYKARVYDPVLGRFLQTDPVGYADNMNLYAYVGNDPLSATDPTGEMFFVLVVPAIEEVIVVGAAISTWCSGDPTCKSFVGDVGREIQKQYNDQAMRTIATAYMIHGLWQGRYDDNVMTAKKAKPDREQRPAGLPPGTKPVDQDSRLDRDKIHKIKGKRGLNAEPKDWVGIDPAGNIWTNEAGRPVDNGHYTDYLK